MRLVKPDTLWADHLGQIRLAAEGKVAVQVQAEVASQAQVKHRVLETSGRLKGAEVWRDKVPRSL